MSALKLLSNSEQGEAFNWGLVLSLLSILIVDTDRSWAVKTQKGLQENRYDVDVVENGKDAQLTLYRKDYFALILNWDIKNHSGLQVLKWVRLNKPGLKVILVFDSKEYLEEQFDYDDLIKLGANDILEKPFDIPKLMSAIEGQQDFSQIIKSMKTRSTTSDEEEVTNKDNEFTKIKLREFISAKHILFDVYIRLGENKYLKILHAGDTFLKERIDKYQKNKVEDLYFKESDRRRYVRFCNAMSDKMMGNEKVEMKSKVSLIKNASEKYIEEVYTHGLRPSILNEGKEVCDSVYNMIEKEKDLYTLLREYQDFDPSAYSHAFLVTLFASMTLKQFEWESKVMTKTLALACLLHDIGKVKMPMELIAKRPADMTAEELEIYKMHPEYGIEILSLHNSIPPSVRQIVYQHHECSNGQGFPRGIKDPKIFTLAKIVHLCDEFAHAIAEKKILPMKALREFLADESMVTRYNGVVLEYFIKVFVDPKTKDAIDSEKGKTKRLG